MSLDLAFDDGQRAIADSVAQLCADRFDDDAARAPCTELARADWTALAELGVLGLLTPEGEGGALEAVAAMESLGRVAFPGPLAATFVATRVLEEPERSAIASGRRIACVGEEPWWPWGGDADIVLAIEGESLRRARFAQGVTPVATVGGEPWVQGMVVRDEPLTDGGAGLVLMRVLLAAQLAALAGRLVEDASRHATLRKQFGRPIGDFQAVAHPLADCHMHVTAATTLTHAAAFHMDAGSACAPGHAAAAHLSACEAGLEVLSVAHQVFGAVGITLEGPAWHLSRRIRQLASTPPSRDASRALLKAMPSDASPGDGAGRDEEDT